MTHCISITLKKGDDCPETESKMSVQPFLFDATIIIRSCHHLFDSKMPSLETYRRFRFCLYMKILEDSKNMSKADAWEQWADISDYDMRAREKRFLSFVISKLNESNINN